jgi:hypothetical protein
MERVAHAELQRRQERADLERAVTENTEIYALIAKAVASNQRLMKVLSQKIDALEAERSVKH